MWALENRRAVGSVAFKLLLTLLVLPLLLFALPLLPSGGFVSALGGGGLLLLSLQVAHEDCPFSARRTPLAGSPVAGNAVRTNLLAFSSLMASRRPTFIWPVS